MNLKRFLWKTFSIQRDEYSFIFPLFLLYFLSGSFFATGQIFSETIFLKAYGAKGFAKFFIHNGFAIIIAGLFYNYFLLKLPLKKGYIFLVILITSLIGSSHLLHENNYSWLPFYIYMGNYLFTFFLDIHFFNYAFQFLTIRSSKRLLPFLMGAGRLGGIISSILIFSIFSKDIANYGTTIWAINAILIIIPILLLKKSSVAEYERAERKGHELLPDYKIFERIIRKLKLSLSSPIFTCSVLAIFVMSVSNQLSEYYFAKIFNAAFPTKNELSSFLSLYTFIADFITLIFQFFIISRIIRYIGVQNSNMVYPVSFFTLISLCIAFPNIIIGVLIRFFRKNLSHIIKTPIFNIIMASAPKDRMTEVKSFIGDVVSPLGMISGGGAIMLITNKFTETQGYIFSLSIGAVFIFFTLLQNKAYLKALKSRLSFGHTTRDEEDTGLVLHDYEALLSDEERIKENLDAIEAIFNRKPSLELLPYLHLFFFDLSSPTKENILNLLKTTKYDYTDEILTAGLQDSDPLIRGKTLSFLADLPYEQREKLLEITYPEMLESEKDAISILLSKDGRIDGDTNVDDFALMRVLMLKNEIIEGETDPVEFIIFIQVLPYHLLLDHLIDLSLATGDIIFLKYLTPYAYKLSYTQARKVMYIFKNAPIDLLANFIMLAEKLREKDKAILLDIRDIHEDYMKAIFHYDEKLFNIILKRLFKNKSYHSKENYLKYILIQNRKPEDEMERFIEHQIDIIQEITRLRSYICKNCAEREINDHTLPLFTDIALQNIIDLSKHLILKAIAILSGFKVDEIHDSNILLRDRDIDNYILEYIETEASVKYKRRLLTIFEDNEDSDKKEPENHQEFTELFKIMVSHFLPFIPEISELLKYCMSRVFSDLDIDYRIYSDSEKIPEEDEMLSALEKIIFLKKNKLFSELKLTEIIHIAKIAHEIEVPRDKIIINKGDKGTQLFILLNGEVQVYTDDRVLANLGPGSCIGELSIIDEEPRSANVKTLEKTKILSINRNDFLLTLKENPAISINIMQVITNRLRDQIK